MTKPKYKNDFWILAREFLNIYLPNVRNLSKNTIDDYKQSMTDFVAYLENQKRIRRKDITITMFNQGNVKEYIAWMNITKGLSPKTCSLRLTAIKSFLKFCSDEDLVFASLYYEVSGIKGMKHSKKPVMHLSENAISTLLKMPETDTNKAPHKLSKDTARLILSKYAEKAREICPEFPDKIGCHLIRKTRAMNLYNHGIPLPYIMEILGHESEATTKTFYAFATVDVLSDAISKANPEIQGEKPRWKDSNTMKRLYSFD